MPNPKVTHLPILVHHTGSLGDTLASVPGLRAIRASFPSAPIHLLFDVQGDDRALAIDIIRPLDLADEYIPYDSSRSLRRQIPAYLRLWKKLRSRSYARVISLLPSTRAPLSVIRDRAFYTLVGIPNSSSFRFVKFPPDSPLKEAQRRLLRLSTLGIRTSGTDTYHIDVPQEIAQRVRHWLNDQRCFPERPLIAICPGAKKPACLWPLDNFAKLGQKLLHENLCELLLLGGTEHRTEAQHLLSSWGTGIDGVGKFSIFETASALEQCAFMIGVDTGTTHLAAAVGTRCIVIFSQREVSPKWEPMGENHQILRQPVPCQDCGLAVCHTPGHPCMNGITVEAVFARALHMLSAKSATNLPTPINIARAVAGRP